MQTRKIRPGREPPSGLTRWRDAQDADQAMTTLYRRHYRPLVRLAALLVGDLATAEEIVQDSFAAVHERWRALPDADAALAYLRRWVIRQCRAAARLAPAEAAPGAGRERGTSPRGPGSPVVAALRVLPACQREVMVLRYFAELSEAEIVSATGMSPAAVRSHTAQAMSSLHAGLRPPGG